jgi:hypothetical protein
VMCDICKRTILLGDLTVDANGLTVCRSARYCLIAVLLDASPAQIAQLQATASDFALVASQRQLRGLRDVVRTPALAWSEPNG